MTDRLEKQIRFILEVDRLKQVFRQTRLLDGSRYENDAEHSWHLALLAVLFYEYAADEGIDLLRVIKMLLIHDLVEIDAGDTFCYDVEAVQKQKERELEAAERIFNLLPPDQAQDVRALWDEFEERQSLESHFATALDRFQPLLLNFHNQKNSWEEHGVTSDQVYKRNSAIHEGAPELWEHARQMIEEAVAQGKLERGQKT